LIELGGTAGEYQNMFYYEASRILTLRQPDDVVHIHVSYVPTPYHLGEPKTKPTQLSVRTLNSMGIQPDFIVARSEKNLDKRRIDRFALFCNMQPEDIISNPNLSSVYQIPLIFAEQQFEQKILRKLKLKERTADLNQWKKLVQTIVKSKSKTVTLAIVGKYFGTGDYQLRDSYAALFDAIDHAAWKKNLEVKLRWIDAEKIEKDGTNLIGKPDGIIIPIGWGVRGAEGMIQAAGYARRSKIPYLGLCYGMQLAAVSFAREVLGLSKANTTENEPKTTNPIIHIIPSQKKFMEKRAYGGTMRLGAWKAKLAKNSFAYEIYKKYNQFLDGKDGLISERHRHRYEFNDKYTKRFADKGCIVSARSIPEGLPEIMELSKKIHPFYLGTQGHPEYKSRPLSPHPIFLEFLDACKK